MTLHLTGSWRWTGGDGFKARTHQLQECVLLRPLHLTAGESDFQKAALSSSLMSVRCVVGLSHLLLAAALLLLQGMHAQQLQDRTAAQPSSGLARLSPAPTPSHCTRGGKVCSEPHRKLLAGQAWGDLTSRPVVGGPGTHSQSMLTLPLQQCGCVHLSESQFPHQETQGEKPSVTVSAREGAVILRAQHSALAGAPGMPWSESKLSPRSPEGDNHKTLFFWPEKRNKPKEEKRQLSRVGEGVTLGGRQ